MKRAKINGMWRHIKGMHRSRHGIKNGKVKMKTFVMENVRVRFDVGKGNKTRHEILGVRGQGPGEKQRDKRNDKREFMVKQKDDGLSRAFCRTFCLQSSNLHCLFTHNLIKLVIPQSSIFSLDHDDD